MTIPNYDEEFEKNLNLAKRMIKKIKDKSDQTTALKYFTLLTNLKSKDINVKKNRNAFFKYFLQTLEEQLTTEAKRHILCHCKLQEGLSDPLKYLQKEMVRPEDKVVTHWSDDRRSYVSAKIIPGRGALLYMAVSSDVLPEWDIRIPKKI